MIISDVFNYEGKQAIYIRTDGVNIPDQISRVVVKNKSYNVVKHETTHSIIGSRAITLLIDTTDTLFAGDSVDIY